MCFKWTRIKLACIYNYCRTGVVFLEVGGKRQSEETRADRYCNMATIEDVCVESSSTDPFISNDQVNGYLQDSGDELTVETPPLPAPFIRNDSGASLNSLKLSSISARPFQGPRFKLINEGDIQICRLNHTRTIVSKIMNSKYLRRWESHRIVLDKNEIRSCTVSKM